MARRSAGSVRGRSALPRCATPSSAPIAQLHALRARLAERCAPENSSRAATNPGRSTGCRSTARWMSPASTCRQGLRRARRALRADRARARAVFRVTLLQIRRRGASWASRHPQPRWAAARQKAALDPAWDRRARRGHVKEFGFESIKLKGGCFEPAQEGRRHQACAALWSRASAAARSQSRWTVETSIERPRTGGTLNTSRIVSHAGRAWPRCGRAEKPRATNMCTTSFDDLPGSVKPTPRRSSDRPSFWGGLRASMELAAWCRNHSRGVSMHSKTTRALACRDDALGAMPKLTTRSHALSVQAEESTGRAD